MHDRRSSYDFDADTLPKMGSQEVDGLGQHPQKACKGLSFKIAVGKVSYFDTFLQLQLSINKLVGSNLFGLMQSLQNTPLIGNAVGSRQRCQ